MTTTYSISRDSIITTALRKLQVLELGTTPDASTITNSAQSLNIMMKAWQSQGIKLWTVQEYAIPLVASQTSYTLGHTQVKTGIVTISVGSPAIITYVGNGLEINTPIVFSTTGALPTGMTAGTYYVLTTPTPDTFTISNTVGGVAINTTVAGSGVHTVTITSPTVVTQTVDKPLKVIQGWVRNISVTPYVDIPVQILSRQEYNTLGSKFATGQVNSIWYNPSTTYGEVRTYLTPDATIAANYVLYVVGQRPIQDISLSTDIPDFPTEWMQALIWGLADELSIEYGLPANHRAEIAMKAEKYRKDLEDWDVETTSTFFTPDTRGQLR